MDHSSRQMPKGQGPGQKARCGLCDNIVRLFLRPAIMRPTCLLLVLTPLLIAACGTKGPLTLPPGPPPPPLLGNPPAQSGKTAPAPTTSTAPPVPTSPIAP